MIIGFVESSYAVGEEEESVSVCVVLTGQTAIALGITILTQGRYTAVVYLGRAIDIVQDTVIKDKHNSSTSSIPVLMILKKAAIATLPLTRHPQWVEPLYQYSK